MNTIVIYPGRFSPFGKHHYETYKWIVNRFGVDNVYITTSDVVSEKSPLNFKEKSAVIQKYGIKVNKICKSDRPYMPTSLLDNFDKETDRLIIVYGQKDYRRIGFQKKDGSAAYFKRYIGQQDMESFKNSAYVVVAPHVSLNHKGNELCGTYLRQLLSACTRKEMYEVLGWNDENLYSLFRRKFNPNFDFTSNTEPVQPKKEDNFEAIFEVENYKDVFESNTFNQGKYTRHIAHPYEAELSFLDLKRFTFDVTKNVTAIDNCTLKLDGYNLQMTFKAGQFVCSRNKSTVLNPMTYEQLRDKYVNKPDTQFAFCESFKAMELLLTKIEKTALNSIFNNGRTFLNFEIVHERVRNVFKYTTPVLSIHSMITYNEEGNETHRINSVPTSISKTLGMSYNGFTIIGTPQIELKPVTTANYLMNKLLLIQHRFRIPESANIALLPRETLQEIKLFTFELGNEVIKTNYEGVDRNNNVNNIIGIVEKVGDDATVENEANMFDYSIQMLDKLGGYKSLNPIEGFVLEWENKVLKLTGSFGCLVPVFNLWNKKRF